MQYFTACTKSIDVRFRSNLVRRRSSAGVAWGSQEVTFSAERVTERWLTVQPEVLPGLSYRVSSFPHWCPLCLWHGLDMRLIVFRWIYANIWPASFPVLGSRKSSSELLTRKLAHRGYSRGHSQHGFQTTFLFILSQNVAPDRKMVAKYGVLSHLSTLLLEWSQL